MEELEKLVKELQAKVNTLAENNSALTSIIRTSEKEEYDRTYTAISDALERGDVLEQNFWNTWTAIQKDDVEQDLLQANSPTSDKLGFDFSKVILEAVDETITNKIKFDDPKQNKPRWTKIVAKIVNNDLVSSLLKSNPISATVSSVISSAANFFESKVKAEVVKNEAGKKVINGMSKISNVIDEERIREFVGKMKPYIEFYNKLLEISITYQADLENMQAKAETLRKSANNYYSNLLKELSFSKRKNKTNQLNELFEYDKKNKDDFGFKSVLGKDNIQKGVKYVSDFINLERDVNTFKQSYNSRYKLFIGEYKTVLNKQIKARNIKGFDSNKVGEIISRIDAVVDTIGSKGNKVSFEEE